MHCSLITPVGNPRKIKKLKFLLQTSSSSSLGEQRALWSTSRKSNYQEKSSLASHISSKSPYLGLEPRSKRLTQHIGLHGGGNEIALNMLPLTRFLSCLWNSPVRYRVESGEEDPICSTWLAAGYGARWHRAHLKTALGAPKTRTTHLPAPRYNAEPGGEGCGRQTNRKPILLLRLSGLFLLRLAERRLSGLVIVPEPTAQHASCQ